MAYIIYKFAAIWVWFLFLASLAVIAIIYYVYYLYWESVGAAFNRHNCFTASHKHYIFTSAGIPFMSAACSSVFKLFPTCVFKVLKNIHAVSQFIAFGLILYGIFSIMEHHEDNKNKFDARSMHACFGWTTFVLFFAGILISSFLFIPPYLSQDLKRFMIGIHSYISFCTLFFAIMTMMTGNISDYEYIVP